MKRRTYLYSTVGIGVALAGCGGSGGSGSPAIDDELIEADPEEVIVRSDDLDSEWRGGLRESGSNEASAAYVNEDINISIEVVKNSDIESAEERYNQLKSEQTGSTDSNSVSYGNEGFIVNPTDGLVIIGFRAGNLAFGIISNIDQSSSTDAEGPARNMAEIMVEKIVDIQSN
jgi:hypothetical protein